ATVTNTCGGTVTDQAAGALGVGDTGIQVTGAAFAAGVASCTVTFTVTAPAGTYVNQSSNLSALAKVNDDTSPQPGTFVTPPAVTLNSLATINAANASSYTVSGTCTTSAGTVSISIASGAVTASTACAAGAFTTNIDVSSVPDAASVSVAASQTNGGGT